MQRRPRRGSRANHRCIRDLLAGEMLVAVDAGARGGVPTPWRVLDGSCRVIAFEPDADACAELRVLFGNFANSELYSVVPVALSGTGGKRLLYQTAVASGSSLLDPDTPTIRRYVNDSYIFPIMERLIDTETLDEALTGVQEPRVDLIKLDVQGCELEILEGLGDRLESVLCVEIEAALSEHYRHQPTLFAVHEFLSQQGFTLMGIRTQGTWPQRHGHTAGYQRDIFRVHQKSPSIAARLWEVDALYFRESDVLLENGDAGSVRRLAAALCVYRYFCEAYLLLEEAGAAGIIESSKERTARNAVVDWHRTIAHRSYHRLLTAPRHVKRALDKSISFARRNVVLSSRTAHD